MAESAFSSSLSAKIVFSLSIGSIRVDYYPLTYSFKRGFKPHTKVYMALSFTSSGNTATMLSNALMYFFTEPHCCSLYNLFLAMFLLPKEVY